MPRSLELDPLQELVRQLLDQNAETRNLDYKGPMAWAGNKADRAELVRDLMCFSNTPGGGHILIGVEESPSGWVRSGLTEKQSGTFDISKIGDLAGQFCSVQPSFRVQTVPLDDTLYVLISVDEFNDQPIVCTKDLDDSEGHRVLRDGAVYTRSTDAKCSQISDAEAMGRLLDLAVRKRGDVLLAQIAALIGAPVGRTHSAESEQFRGERQEAEAFFAENGLDGPHWQVVIGPGLDQGRIATRSDLRKAREDAAVALRGWDFPHVDREHSNNFQNGIQSVTHFMSHHEGHRVYTSGLFAWRSAIREDFEPGLQGKLMYESSIWSLTEFWLFAGRFLSNLLESGEVAVEIDVVGLRNRELKALRANSFEPYVARENVFSSRHRLPLGEARGRHNELALDDALELFELFNITIQRDVLAYWQERFLKREI